MAVLLYNIFLIFFKAGTRIFGLFNAKARKWVQGRVKIFERLEQSIPKDAPMIWMHCASLGEFEQGRPVLEKIRDIYPGYKILLTFFSPSGYEAQKNFGGADFVFYLPGDGPRNAKRFLDIINPRLVIFVKYEFWYYYLKKIKYRNIPILLISALFRPDMSFFKWYGGLQRKMLSRFDHLFLQDQRSFELVRNIGLENICSVSGDTRFDRVLKIASNAERIPVIEAFLKNKQTIIAGSTWQEDEELIQKVLPSFNKNLNWIIAPHEVSESHLNNLKKLFPTAILYSELSSSHQHPTSGSQPAYRTGRQPASGNILIIDTIGLLSSLYQYAYISYVGGGLRTMGVHNVLEAAVYGKPVLFGNYYTKYQEAIGLVKSGGALPFSDQHKNGVMLTELVNGLLENKDEYSYCSRAAGNFVLANQGATAKIISYIQEKRLLTS